MSSNVYASGLMTAIIFGLAQGALANDSSIPKDANATRPSEQEAKVIPLDQIGAVAGKQYSGDGLSVVATNGGTLLRCVFQRLDGEATKDGLWLKSTVPDDQANDRFRVKAVSVGNEHLADRGDVSSEGGIVRFSRPGLVEEYSVSIDGVRQDFVVMKKPDGAERESAPSEAGGRESEPTHVDCYKREGELRVNLAVSGARVEQTAKGSQLVLERSGRKIAYTQLKVTDAKGEELPARIEGASNSRHRTPHSEFALVVVVDDAEASYPIRIDPTFTDENWISMGGISGVNGWVLAAATDASGNLYAGGSFSVAGTTFALNVAKWDGSSWSALGSGLNGAVTALAVSGNEVFVGGDFTMAGGVSTPRVARWNGTNWSAVGTGMNGSVNALAVANGELYAGGGFTSAGGNAATNIAKWNGSNWSSLGSGMNNQVLALAVSGTNVYAGGRFTVAGGVVAFRTAKWNGDSWSALGQGMNDTVHALHFWGNELYAGGEFWQADYNPANRVAKWNGSTWSALNWGVGTSSFDASVVLALTSVGTNLYVAGDFEVTAGITTRKIARWHANGWSNVGFGLGPPNGGVGSGEVYALAATSSNVFAGGNFQNIGVHPAKGVMRWELTVSDWRALGVGADSPCRALAISGTNVYAVGHFTTLFGYSSDYISRWNGINWVDLGFGLAQVQLNAVTASGTNVYVAGAFTTAHTTPANHIARWNGVAWSALGNGLNGFATAVTVSGTNVYVAGQFTTAGGVPANRIAKWNGNTWSALGSGLDGFVHALAVSGDDVYAGGQFTSAGGVYSPYIAKWNGTNWSALGDGMDNYVRALAVSGSNVYAGGDFATAGGISASRVAKWNGSSWSAMGSGFYPAVYALAISGTDVYAGGWITTAGFANSVAKWNGTTWSALGSALGGVGSPQVYALAATSNSVYVGGDFLTAGGKLSAYVTRAFTGEEYLYVTNNGAITITKYIGPGGAVNIPSTLNGLPVVAIARYSFNTNNSISSVVIPFGVTTIDFFAFGFSGSITNISLPNSLLSIGSSAFAGCSGLRTITIPASATDVDLRAFDYCFSLTNISVDAQNPTYSSVAGAWFNKTQTRLLTCPAGMTGHYTIPHGVTNIGAYSFQYCTSLTNITVPSTVQRIEDSAFSSCYYLAGVYFLGNAPSIGTGIFTYVNSAIVYYVAGAIGWSGTFGGRPTMALTLNPPAISVQPFSRTNVVGSTAQWRVTASGAAPLAFQWRKDGTNLSNGAGISGVTTTNLAIANVQSNHAGGYRVVVTNVFGSVTSSLATLTVAPPPSPAEFAAALDTTNLVWSTSGHSSWFAQTNVTHDGADALQSGPVVRGETTIVSTTVTGPGTLTFWWKASSSGLDNSLRFYRDEIIEQVFYAYLTDHAWELSQAVYLDAGEHNLTWDFYNGNATVAGNAGWVDQVTFAPGGTAPHGLVLEERLPAWLGGSVVFEAWATGTPPLTYELLRNNTVFDSNTNGIFALDNVQPPDVESAYSIRITNYYGVATLSNLAIYLTPVAVWGSSYQSTPEGLTNVQQIAGGGFHSLAVHSSGTVAAWGDNYVGQCNVPTNLAAVIAVSGGMSHSLALRSNGTVAAWGSYFDGADWAPIPPLTQFSNVVQVAAGDQQSLVLLSNGTALGWEWDLGGEPLVTSVENNVRRVAIGNTFALVVKSNGTVVAWGDNSYGQTDVPLELSSVKDVAAGELHALALRSNGTVVAWGSYYDGSDFVPATIPDDLSNVVAIAAGGSQSLAIRADKTLVTWGYQDGMPLTTPPGVHYVLAVAAGGNHALALLREPVTIVVNDGSMGFVSNKFGFKISGQLGQTAAVEVSTNLVNWLPVQTNTFGTGPIYFSDPNSPNFLMRFYRQRSL